MSLSRTTSKTVAFTRTDAKHISYKVATDLRRMRCFYGEHLNGSLSDSWIDAYEAELIAYLMAGYLDWVAYGFLRNGNWIDPILYYSADMLEQGRASDDDPGGIRPGEDVSGAVFHSFLVQNHRWNQLSDEAKREFKRYLPVQRTPGMEPSADGTWVKDRTYSAKGRALNRLVLMRYR